MLNKSTNKEEILNRLYSHAVTFWGLNDIESLDPAIKVLIQGLASEIFNVSNEVENTKVRILNSLADVLTPSDFNSPKCSHGVMQAYPVEEGLVIDNRTSFFIEKLPSGIRKEGISRIDFTPVKPVRLFQASIPYSISERIFYKHDQANIKQQIAFTHVLSEVYNYTVWFALDLKEKMDTIKNVSFYIDFPKSSKREEFLSILTFSQWEINGRTLKMEAGLPELEEEDLSIFEKYDLNHQFDRNVSKYYHRRFQTIQSDIKVSELRKEIFPEELKALYDVQTYENLELMFWFKVKMPVNIQASDLYHISIHVNALPVVNKKRYEKTFRQSSLSGIIPLRTEPGEVFLSVDQVTDEFGNEFEYIPYKPGSNSCTYHVKRGGVERFDTRDAHDIIDYLTDLLRSEISAFSSYGVEYITTTIKELRKELNLLESKMDNQSVSAERNYLMLNTKNRESLIFYSYWGTACELANKLGAGQTLLPYNSAMIQKGTCRLLTTTTGGASAPDSVARLDAFKFSLTSRDQIHTNEDIVNFCRYELGSKICRIEVRQGIMVSLKPKEGLVRCLDVILTAAEGYKDKLEQMSEGLKLSLEERSPDSFNYRMVIK